MEEFAEFEPHLVLMDIFFRFTAGFTGATEYAEQAVFYRVLSCQSDNMSVVMAMNRGGDDFIAKPVDMDVLIAKINAMLRRSYDCQGDAYRSVLRGLWICQHRLWRRTEGERS